MCIGISLIHRLDDDSDIESSSLYLLVKRIKHKHWHVIDHFITYFNEMKFLSLTYNGEVTKSMYQI